MSKNHVWIVEIEWGKIWRPRYKVHALRSDARDVAMDFRNQGANVRVRKYMRAGK